MTLCSDVEFDPRLVETALLLALKGRPEERLFHRDREAAYVLSDPEAKDAAFTKIHARWFRRLSLGDPVRWALREEAAALSAVTRWRVAPALSDRQAGAELFVADSKERTVVILIVPSTLVRPDQAQAFLRRELLYIADMLDPAFEYEPRLPRSPLGPPVDRRMKDRYAALWRASVEGRLVRAEKIPAEARELCWRGFLRHFGCLGDQSEACFEKIFDGERPIHPVFVALASDPEVAFGVRRTSSERSRRCPLCGFPTTAFEPDPETLPADVQGEILGDFPAWDPHRGLCLQCADLYRARTDLIPQSATAGARRVS